VDTFYINLSSGEKIVGNPTFRTLDPRTTLLQKFEAVWSQHLLNLEPMFFNGDTFLT
jgi:hypothetical protein